MFSSTKNNDVNKNALELQGIRKLSSRGKRRHADGIFKKSKAMPAEAPARRKSYFAGLKGNYNLWNVFKKICIYSAAVAVMFVLVFGTIDAMEVELGSEVIVNGKTVGLIGSKAEFTEILNEVTELAKAAHGGVDVEEILPVYIPRLVSREDITPDFKIRQNLLANYDALMEGYAVYVDDTLICATIEEQEVFGALNTIKKQYIGDANSNMTARFIGDVSVRKEFVPISQIMTGAGVISALSGTSTHNEIYTVVENDTVWDIAKKFDMSVDMLIEMNKGITEQMYAGQKINVVQRKALVSVETTALEEYDVAISYNTSTVEDSQLGWGETQVVKSGAEGAKHFVANVVRVNGQEIARDIQSEQLISSPSDEIIKIGTNKSATGSAIASGVFRWPVYGTITSRFGNRWGSMHTGVDIALDAGSSIYAADAGVVICAEYTGSYGKLVKVDHGNGFVTFYAHCSSILVSEGQKVKKGEVVARVGSTGNSTGPHLHFEVRKNGIPQDPTNFLK